jgi:phage tail-like protein
MALESDRPYGQMNFLVDIGEGTAGAKAGFQEVSGLGMEVSVAEYRNGNSPTNNVIKVQAISKQTDVTLKRGVMGALNLYEWIDKVRNGDRNARKAVTIMLMTEDHSAPVFTWRLLEARPAKYTTGPFSGKGTDVAIEELVLTYERLEMM